MMIFPNSSESICKSFRPLTGISLFLCLTTNAVRFSSRRFSSPHGDFSFSMSFQCCACSDMCFRPLTGISLFLFPYVCPVTLHGVLFSSPHGDFSFSIVKVISIMEGRKSFRPLTGISLFLFSITYSSFDIQVFVPSRGFLFFYEVHITNTNTQPVFVPSRGFLFFYRN